MKDAEWQLRCYEEHVQNDVTRVAGLVTLRLMNERCRVAARML